MDDNRSEQSEHVSKKKLATQIPEWRDQLDESKVQTAREKTVKQQRDGTTQMTQHMLQDQQHKNSNTRGEAIRVSSQRQGRPEMQVVGAATQREKSFASHDYLASQTGELGAALQKDIYDDTLDAVVQLIQKKRDLEEIVAKMMIDSDNKDSKISQMEQNEMNLQQQLDVAQRSYQTQMEKAKHFEREYKALQTINKRLE